MAKKNNIDQKDIDAFYQAVKGTQPLSQKKIRLSPPAAPSKKTVIDHFHSDRESLYFSEANNLEQVEGEEFIAYKHVSISNKILRKLRKGQYNVDAVLDLHSLSVEEARTATDHFLQECLHAGVRVVLIIHGKGSHSHMPILKNKLNHWLREIDVVLAFCSAAPSHGSRGATYVLLKRTMT